MLSAPETWGNALVTYVNSHGGYCEMARAETFIGDYFGLNDHGVMQARLYAMNSGRLYQRHLDYYVPGYTLKGRPQWIVDDLLEEAIIKEIKTMRVHDDHGLLLDYLQEPDVERIAQRVMEIVRRSER